MITRWSLLVLCLALGLAMAGLQKFEDQTIPTNSLVAKRVAMYSAADAPSTRAPGNGQSSLHLELTMKAAASEAYSQTVISYQDDTPRATVAILHADLFALIGNKDVENGEPSFCCVSDLVGRAEGCETSAQVGDLLIPHLLKKVNPTSAPSTPAPTQAATVAPTQGPTAAPTPVTPTPASNTTNPSQNKTSSSLPISKYFTLFGVPSGSGFTSGTGDSAYWFGQIRFNGTKPSDLLIERNMLGDFAVQVTGNHYIVVANCDPRIQTLTVNGPVVALNPYGYLPAELYGFLPFYASMTLCYVTVTLGWLVMVMMYSDELLPLQLHLSGVLLLSMVEMLTWYLDYVNFNEVGERRVAPFLFGICAAVIRRTLSRMLVIAVSLGYGVVRPDLGKSRDRLFWYGGIYFVLEAALEIVTELSHAGHTEIHNQVQFALTFPVAMLDGIAYWWIFVALSSLMTQLEQRKQQHKLEMYRNFSRVLVVSLAFCGVFAAYQMYFVNANMVEQPVEWKFVWIMDGGFWNMQYTLLLFSILFLWRPSPNAKHYALAQELSGEDDENPSADNQNEEHDDEPGDIEMSESDQALSGFPMQAKQSLMLRADDSTLSTALGLQDEEDKQAAIEMEEAFDIDEELSGPHVQSATGRQSDSDSDSEVGHHVSSQIVASNFDDFDDDDELGVTQQALQQHAKSKSLAASNVTSPTFVSPSAARPMRINMSGAVPGRARAGSGASAALGAALMGPALAVTSSVEKMALREATLAQTK